MRSRILITGGAGFIGARVTALLAARGHALAVLDNESVGRALPPRQAQMTPYHADIRDAETVDGIFHLFRPEVVIHLAALHHIPTCEREPERARDINITGTQVLLEAAARHHVSQLVLASSAAVYDWHDGPLIEDETPLRASDVYSDCKLANERQVTEWAAQDAARRVAIARIFNAIGHDDPNGHLIPDILAQLGGSATAHIQLGNLAPKRDYTHADDTARGLVALLGQLEKGRAVEAYNISYGAEYSVAELAHAIAGILGITLTIGQDPSRVRRIDRLHLLGDTRKMRGATAWKAEHDFPSALQSILRELMPAIA